MVGKQSSYHKPINPNFMTTENLAREVALTALKMGAIKLSPREPFRWAAGNLMPIYNDNRIFLSSSYGWGLVLDGLTDIVNDLEKGNEFNVIAGTAMAGIPHAAALAYSRETPMIYVRDKAKDHGLRNQIEGIAAENDLAGKKVVLIEDLISTGKSSVKAVAAIREAKGDCDHCVSIFSYGFDKPKKMFAGEESFGDKDNPQFLSRPCEVRSLITYDILLEVAKETDYLKEEEIAMLADWREDPFGWAKKHGFEKVAV
jgi:orotate phosphoribosyltransferase